MIRKLSYLCVLALLSSCSQQEEEEIYIPVDTVLYNEIVGMDRQFFDAYNSCDLETQEAIYADDIEFFHDKGGRSDSKADLIQKTKDNICGKVQRELVANSIEVYPIPDYGAIEIGLHSFHNNEEPDAISTPSKFICFWRKDEEKWKMAKVVSLH